MFERHRLLEENDLCGSPSPPPTADGSEKAAPLDSRLEDYLDHVCAPLVGLVPYARRQELRAELRGHLEALVATHEELGSARDAAVVLGLRQFGPPRDLARRWAREWAHGTAAPMQLEPAWRAMLIALGSFGAATLLALGMLLIVVLTADHPLPDVLREPVGFSMIYLLPVLAGLAVGLLAPARHALGTFYAQAILIVPSAALTAAALIQPPDSASFDAWHLPLSFVLVQLLWWTPIGCAAAALGGSLRARRSLRPQRWVLQ
jgi:hypothetical protein